MRQRDAERAAKRFLAGRYPYHYAQWNFDICFEHGAMGRSKVASRDADTLRRLINVAKYAIDKAVPR